MGTWPCIRAAVETQIHRARLFSMEERLVPEGAAELQTEVGTWAAAPWSPAEGPGAKMLLFHWEWWTWNFSNVNQADQYPPIYRIFLRNNLSRRGGKRNPVEIATPFEVHGTSFDTLRVEAALQRVATEVEEGTFWFRLWCLAPISINLDPASTH